MCLPTLSRTLQLVTVCALCNDIALQTLAHGKQHSIAPNKSHCLSQWWVEGTCNKDTTAEGDPTTAQPLYQAKAYTLRFPPFSTMRTFAMLWLPHVDPTHVRRLGLFSVVDGVNCWLNASPGQCTTPHVDTTTPPNTSVQHPTHTQHMQRQHLGLCTPALLTTGMPIAIVTPHCTAVEQ